MRLTFPLWLTLGRIAVIPLVLVLLYLGGTNASHLAAVLFLLAAVTDWLDGWLARRWEQTSAFGAFLDPVADKLLVAVALVMLLHAHPGGGLAVLVSVIIGREITISALREWLAEIGDRRKVAVNLMGKLKTVLQMTAITWMLWGTPLFGIDLYFWGYALLVVAAALTLWSMVLYLRAAAPSLLDADHATRGDGRGEER